jgi:TRAP-type uncharacterized transport system fused permease subunit
MMRTWKYTLPAFLVPFAFVLSPRGEGLMMQAAPQSVVVALIASAVAVCALGVATGGWILGPANHLERALAAVAAIALLYLEPLFILVGAAALAAAAALHVARRRRNSVKEARATASRAS